MQHSEFRIGSVFRCGDKRWRCTDVGSRVIVAICLDHDDDPSWYNGPSYALTESVFDEDDLQACSSDNDAALGLAARCKRVNQSPARSSLNEVEDAAGCGRALNTARPEGS